MGEILASGLLFNFSTPAVVGTPSIKVGRSVVSAGFRRTINGAKSYSGSPVDGIIECGEPRITGLAGISQPSQKTAGRRGRQTDLYKQVLGVHTRYQDSKK